MMRQLQFVALVVVAGVITRVDALSVAIKTPSLSTRVKHAASVKMSDSQTFLIHEGRSKDMILRSPSLAGITLIENWNVGATQDLLRAVSQVVEANPILRGRVEKKHNRLWIQGDTTSSSNDQDFLRILDTPANAPDFSKITDAKERLEVLQEQLVPLFDPCELTSTQIKRKLPLFGVTLVLLPGNYAVYAVHMSHAVGDGVTFFSIVKQLSMFMSGLPLEHPIKWDCPAKATHEFYPPGSSMRDVHFTYGAPMLLGLLRNFPSLSSRETKFELLEKSKVNTKKRELRIALNSTDISANDVITSALCEACHSSDLFLFTENVRHNGGPIPLTAGGNFLVEVPVSREKAIQPEQLRRVVSRHGEYAPNTLPWKPFFYGRTGRITSLASIAETVSYNGTRVICTVPLASFISEIPLDVGVIFRYDNQHWGILHNFAKFDPKAKLMADLLNNDK